MRLSGAAVIVLAVVVLVTTVVVAALDGPLAVIIGVAVAGALAVLVGGFWLSRIAWVVRLDTAGYAVRWVRSVGTARGAWTDVREAVSARPHDIPCLVLHRHDGASTTIPVPLLAANRDRFAEDVRDRLRAAHADPA